MTLAAALIYWLIIALWLAVLAAVAAAFIRNPKTFGTARLLLAVLIIDTVEFPPEFADSVGLAQNLLSLRTGTIIPDPASTAW
jgi:hypothetical protein